MKKLLLTLLISCNTVYAAPVAVAKSDGTAVTLYDEPCAYTQVVDMPYRATWQEKGQTFEGCFVPRPDIGVVVAYFAGDRSVAIVPLGLFAPLRSL